MAEIEKAILHLKKDLVMKNIIESTPEYKKDFEAGQDVYLALLESICSQQISVKAADSIFKKFCDLFDDKYPHADILLNIIEEELRTAGLSFQKIKYFKSVADFKINKKMDYGFLQTLDDEAVVQYFLPIAGVGRWTVEMLLIFVLKRENIYPFDDLVVRQKTMKAYKIDLTGKLLKQKCMEIASNWEPYRSVASRYLWRWKPE